MTTITRERLLKIQQWLETYGPGSNVVLPAEEAEELARIALASLTAEPTVTFYRDGIEVAATWVDQQRESYDSEHGRHDPDTGAFEFGNDAQRDYSATLEEIAEGIRALHPDTAPPSPIVPEEKPMPKASNMFVIDAVAAIAEARGWNACRAAMLQGKAEQPQNAQQNIPGNIPEGYALVPIDATRAMIDAASCVEEDGYDAMHKAMIAAAPQQEVK